MTRGHYSGHYSTEICRVDRYKAGYMKSGPSGNNRVTVEEGPGQGVEDLLVPAMVRSATCSAPPPTRPPLCC